MALGLPQEAAARWIAANTPERSVFVTDAFINSPVDLAGRLRITTFGAYVSNLGYDPAPREVDTKAIYCDGPDVAAERMAKYGATYVLSSGGAPVRRRRRPPTSPRATGSRRSTTRTGSRSGGWPGRSAPSAARVVDLGRLDLDSGCAATGDQHPACLQQRG